ncbi:hypothetical protein PAXRUDRAFT_797109, partial [Paxillus rubicundulus Ve08.2h10]
HILQSKALHGLKDINWAKQNSPLDPHEAFNNHLKVNSPPANGPLSTYCNGRNHKALTKSKFLTTLTTTLKASGRPPLQGHGIRISATLKYLLRNMPFDIVKVKGRWVSNVFLVYLRHHTQILAPYMQAQPALHKSFLRITLPPVR